jgi:hypothetical protein
MVNITFEEKTNIDIIGKYSMGVKSSKHLLKYTYL